MKPKVNYLQLSFAVALDDLDSIITYYKITCHLLSCLWADISQFLVQVLAGIYNPSIIECV